MANHNIHVIIPAKGSSSRLEKKNIRPLNGKPLLVYAIETAQEWGRTSSIYVNSDDEDVLRIAVENGAECYKRPSELGKGDVLAIEVVKDQILTQQINLHDIIVLLQVTCPLRNDVDLENAFKLFIDNGMKAGVVSVTEFEKAPEQAFYIGKQNRLLKKYPGDYHLLTHDHFPQCNRDYQQVVLPYT